MTEASTSSQAPSLRDMAEKMYSAKEEEEKRRLPSTLPPLPQNRKAMVCEVWLDELIQGLYEDLSEYMDFRRLDSQVERKAARSHDSDGVASMASAAVPDMERLPFAKFESADWMRLGMLCERLGRPEDAERCYRTCVAMSDPKVNMTSLLGLQRLYAYTFAWPRELIAVAVQVLEVHAATDDSGDEVMSPSVCGALAAAVAKCGLQAVRDAIKNDPACCSKPRIRASLESLLHEFVRWQSLGFDT